MYGRVISDCAAAGDVTSPTLIAVRIALRFVFIIDLNVMTEIDHLWSNPRRHCFHSPTVSEELCIFDRDSLALGSRPAEATITIIAIHLEADVRVFVHLERMCARSR
jgi:hypothetical protein